MPTWWAGAPSSLVRRASRLPSNNGVVMPRVGFGTYTLKGEPLVEALRTALGHGVHPQADRFLRATRAHGGEEGSGSL